MLSLLTHTTTYYYICLVCNIIIQQVLNVLHLHEFYLQDFLKCSLNILLTSITYTMSLSPTPTDANQVITYDPLLLVI